MPVLVHVTIILNRRNYQAENSFEVSLGSAFLVTKIGSMRAITPTNARNIEMT
jgi:hypothetical protein